MNAIYEVVRPRPLGDLLGFLKGLNQRAQTNEGKACCFSEVGFEMRVGYTRRINPLSRERELSDLKEFFLFIFKTILYIYIFESNVYVFSFAEAVSNLSLKD